MTQPLDLDQIEANAAYLDEYALLADEPLQSTADHLFGTDVPAMAAEIRRLRAERDAFRDQRNAVFQTNQRLIGEAEAADHARLLAENETRTLTRANLEAAERAQRVIDELRAELAEGRAKALATEADQIVVHCPDHGPQDQDGVWMDCHCAVADDMRRRAAAVSAAARP